MIVSTLLNLIVTPVLYVVIAGIEERLGMGRHARPTISGEAVVPTSGEPIGV